MIDDEQPQALNIFDIIQGNSYTETISNILDMSQGNEVFKDLLLRGFYQNPKREIHNQINSVHDKSIKAAKKFNWKCEHDGCNKPSAYSHELSERAVLSYLADSDHMAFILKRNLKNNSFEFSFEEKHIRDILNFSGYCSEHDQSLFKLLDHPGMEIDLEYVNLQALKMMRRRILNYEVFLKVTKDILDEINLLISNCTNPDEEIKDIKELIDIYQEIIKHCESSLKESRGFYKKLWGGIKSREYIIDYVKLPCYKLGWVFSHTVELESDKTNENLFSFIFKMDINSQPILIHAWEKNSLICKYEDFHITLEEIIECVLINKEKIAFSINFLKSINPIYLDYFLVDEEIYKNVKNPVFIYLFKTILINNPEDDSA